MAPCSSLPSRCFSRAQGAIWRVALAGAVVLGAARSSRADEALHVIIDRLVALQTADYEKLAAPVSSDEEFLRRIALDLTGTIPSTADARQFLDDADSNKREKLVDKLLASPEYARHMQRVFDVMLIRQLPQKHLPDAEWRKSLTEAVA